MEILLDLLKGLLALIATAALSLFGVEMHAPRSIEREVERVQVCAPEQASPITGNPSSGC